jgi:succinate-acetate transporter protein
MEKQTAEVAPRRPNTLIKPDLSSALLVVASLLMTALLAATALFFTLALLPLAFLSLAIFVLALLSGTTRFAGSFGLCCDSIMPFVLLTDF